MHQLTLSPRAVAAWAYALAAVATAACSGGGEHSAGPNPASAVDGGSPEDSGGPTGSQDSGATALADDSPASNPPASPDARSETGPAVDGAALEGGTASGDGGSSEGGTRDVGSCCSAQTTPGCDDPNLEVCVCQKIASCCTTAWTLACALIVQQKYCQPNVRDCVCGTDAGQWGQTQCCMNDWSSTCDSVATLKCNAPQGCF